MRWKENEYADIPDIEQHETSLLKIIADNKFQEGGDKKGEKQKENGINFSWSA